MGWDGDVCETKKKGICERIITFFFSDEFNRRRIRKEYPVFPV